MQYTAINNEVPAVIDKMCAITEKPEKTRPSHWITSKMLNGITKQMIKQPTAKRGSHWFAVIVKTPVIHRLDRQKSELEER